MREKNRKPIASLNMFPQFTTMNVIDGQAGVIIYSSLICYSLTIDNILNIIVLLILAGVTIATLTGDNGLLTKAGSAKTQTEIAEECEKVKLAVIQASLNGKNTIEDIDSLKNALKNNGFSVDDNNLEQTSNGFKYTGAKYRKYQIAKDGKIKTLEKDAIFYSDLVIGNAVNYKGYEAENDYDSNWNIYYADDNNVFLIKKNTYLINLSSKSLDEEVTYGGITDFYANETKSRFPIFETNYLYNKVVEKNIQNTPVSFKMSEYLFDSNNWLKFKNEYTNYVIGSPSVDLLQKSLEKEREQKGEQIPMLESDIDDTMLYPGYTLTLSSTIPSNSVNRNSMFAGAFYGSNSTYWEQRVWYVSGGNVGTGNASNAWYVRPVICLKPDVMIYENENGSYDLRF